MRLILSNDVRPLSIIAHPSLVCRTACCNPLTKRDPNRTGLQNRWAIRSSTTSITLPTSLTGNDGTDPSGSNEAALPCRLMEMTSLVNTLPG